MATIWQRFSMAIKAFREGYVTSDLLDSGEYEDFDARKLRYQILWAMYESTMYRDIHTWSQAFRNSYGLYKSIRNIYNPSYRLVEFWKMMVWGGFLDDEAGEEGAIPIRTTADGVREAIKMMWMGSNWNINKDILVGWGASLGDTAIQVIDDVDNQEIRLEPVHPAYIKDVEYDPKGQVIWYQFEETRKDEKGKDFSYGETAELLDNGLVQYTTYKDGEPAAFGDQPAEWKEDYGFVPLIMIQHNNVGMPWGWAESHPARSKINEIEDLASKLSDYIRKVVDPIWLFNFKKPTADDAMQYEKKTATTDRPQPVREDIPAIYVPNPNASAKPLVTDMIDVEKTLMAINNLLSELERDFPELQMDIWSVGGYTTGKAMKTARQRVERKVMQRRPNYDGALIRAHRMGMVIGKKRGYEGFKNVTANDIDDDSLDHTIPANRIIFETDELEEIKKRGELWKTIIDVVSKGGGQIPLRMVLKDYGWSEDKVEEYMSAAEELQAELDAQQPEPEIASETDEGEAQDDQEGPEEIEER